MTSPVGSISARIASDFLGSLKVGEPVAAHNLAMFPLFTRSTPGADAAAPAPWLTLAQAQAAGAIEITEVSEGGSVPNLSCRNKGEKGVILLDGEELAGAKQNRVLNLTVLVAAKSSVIIPVSCVERGRWAWRGRHFEGRDRVLFNKARSAKAAQVSQRMSYDGARNSDQGAVWDAIQCKSSNLGTSSPTCAMGDAYDQAAPRLDEYVRGLPAAEGQTGAVFAINGRVEGVDLFPSPSLMDAYLPKLVRGYAMDAIEEFRPGAPETPVSSVAVGARDLLARVAAAEARSFPALGLGEDLRFTGPGLAGGALVAEGTVVHLCAFRMAETAHGPRLEDEGCIRRSRRARG